MADSCPRCGSLRAEKAKPCGCGYLMETAFTPVPDGQSTGIVRHEASEPNLDRTIENLPLARHWVIQLFLQLGPSGIFLAVGGLAGLVVAFLPLKSATAAFFGQGGFGSTMVVEDWRGMVGLVGYGGALVMAVMLFPARGLPARGWVWAGIGIGTLTAIMAGWLLISCLADSGRDGVPGFIMFEVKPGIGVFLNMLAAIAVAAGACIRAISVLRATR